MTTFFAPINKKIEDLTEVEIKDLVLEGVKKFQQEKNNPIAKDHVEDLYQLITLEPEPEPSFSMKF